MEKILRKVITEAATTHVGVKKVNRNSKPAITNEIKKMMTERNQLRKDIKKEGGREKWLKKCKEVRQAIRQEKEDRWKEYVEQLDTKTNSKEVWRTIRAMDGRMAPRKDNEVLIVKDKAYVGDKEKANQFAKVYKKESILREKKQKVSTKEKIMKRQNRKFLDNKTSVKDEYEEEIK